VLFGQRLIAEGLSDSLELRVFETGWSGGKATNFFDRADFSARPSRRAAPPAGTDSGAVLRARHGRRSPRFRVEPIHEPGRAKSVLDIPDPYLLSYLRWSDHLSEPEE
jgi:hypothetical protein